MVAAAYGDGTQETRHRFEQLRDTLRDEVRGVECKRMDYAGLRQRGLPIGSGIVEAACKTLVAQRLKASASLLR